MLKTILMVCLALVSTQVVAQDLPPLNPGEILVSIDGVPVNQLKTRQVGNLGFNRFVVNRNQAAYNHALREAQILAQRGTAGHPLGCAPGCSRSGTGYSWGPTPNHCFYGELPDSMLVARACVRGRNGAYFWSAHYR